MSTTVKKRSSVSTGICNFCQTEIDKAKMTQHLKHCKQRLASFSSGKSSAHRQQGKLLHLLVEGRYRPQYWMHLEIPASESLLTLDGFLRDTWLECCNHLSSFTINGINYMMASEEVDPFFSIFAGENGEEISDDYYDEAGLYSSILPVLVFADILVNRRPLIFPCKDKIGAIFILQTFKRDSLIVQCDGCRGLFWLRQPPPGHHSEQ